MCCYIDREETIRARVTKVCVEDVCMYEEGDDRWRVCMTCMDESMQVTCKKARVIGQLNENCVLWDSSRVIFADSMLNLTLCVHFVAEKPRSIPMEIQVSIDTVNVMETINVLLHREEKRREEKTGEEREETNGACVTKDVCVHVRE